MSGNADFLVIGAGLAGSEAALLLAQDGAKVELWEQKPLQFSPAHKLEGPAELVCSNSFKSTEVGSAHGLLKKELELLDSPILSLAYKARVPGGKALSVDREVLSQLVKDEIAKHPLIEMKAQIADKIPSLDRPCLIATGPLTGGNIMQDLLQRLGDDSLYFYDATAPVVTLESLDLDRFFWASRREEDSDDYLNLALNKEEYVRFRQNLLEADKMTAQFPEEELQFFEGCLPIEVLAERGEDTLAFSCMKPVGFDFERGKRPYAVIQFRREKAAAELLSMVGFQTRMKWPEQTRVFRELPGMEKAEFVRLGAMHRNTFINAPKHLSERLELKQIPELYMAGQITGGEGYTEALSTGHYAARQMLGQGPLPKDSAIGSLIRYLVNSSEINFQPMNFNFGLMPDVKAKGDTIKEKLKKRDRKELKAARALAAIEEWRNAVLNPMSTNISASKS